MPGKIILGMGLLNITAVQNHHLEKSLKKLLLQIIAPSYEHITYKLTLEHTSLVR